MFFGSQKSQYKIIGKYYHKSLFVWATKEMKEIFFQVF